MACTVDLLEMDIFIATVPTSIDSSRQPDLTHLEKANELVDKALKTGAFIVYESTGYPSCAEEACAPILERRSGLTFNRDIFCDYSPKRNNQGARKRTLTKAVMVTPGFICEAGQSIDRLYRCIVEVGTHLTSCYEYC